MNQTLTAAQFRKIQSKGKGRPRGPLKPPPRWKYMAAVADNGGSETDVQIALVWEFRRQWPQFAHCIYGTANGATRDGAMIPKAFNMGTVKNWPDLTIPLPRHGFPIMFCELKKAGSYPTKDQKKHLAELGKRGYLATSASGFDAGWALLTWYMSGTGEFPTIKGVRRF